MKLLRWAVAGASVYAVYKYSIGKKAKGEDVLVSPERTVADLEGENETNAPKPKAKPKATPKAPAARSKRN